MAKNFAIFTDDEFFSVSTTISYGLPRIFLHLDVEELTETCGMPENIHNSFVLILAGVDILVVINYYCTNDEGCKFRKILINKDRI